MTFALRLGLTLAALVFVSCQAPIHAQHEYDSSARFSSYKTFAWIVDKPVLRTTEVTSIDLGPLLEREIREAVDRNLIAKGYERGGVGDETDLVVSFSFGTRERIEVDSYPSNYGYRYRRYGDWVSDVHTYTEGTLAVDLFDRGSKQAIWHGWARERLRPTNDQEKRRAKVNAAVDAILKSFPFRNTLNTTEE